MKRIIVDYSKDLDVAQVLNAVKQAIAAKVKLEREGHGLTWMTMNALPEGTITIRPLGPSIHTESFIVKRDREWWMYVLTCADGSFYCGITTNIEERVKVHNKGQGSKYVRSRLPAQLTYQKGPLKYTDALRLERQFKQLTKEQKQAVINGERQL